MSDDPQQAPEKFSDEQPYGGEDSDADTRPGTSSDPDTDPDDTEQDAG
jgi:hypothetical protein